jgi:hypothetical protein
MRHWPHGTSAICPYESRDRRQGVHRQVLDLEALIGLRGFPPMAEVPRRSVVETRICRIPPVMSLLVRHDWLSGCHCRFAFGELVAHCLRSVVVMPCPFPRSGFYVLDSAGRFFRTGTGNDRGKNPISGSPRRWNNRQPL